MQILILGNGFDLASGLSTSYDSFFKWRFKRIEQEYTDIQKMLDCFEKDFNEPKVHIGLLGSLNTDPLRTLGIRKNNETISFRSIYTSMIKQIKIMRERNISFFDLYFTMNRKTNADWNDIEREIFSIVKNISKYSNRNSENNLIEIVQNIENNFIGENSLNSRFVNDLFLLMFTEQSKDQISNNIYETLRHELKKLENEFKSYINEIYLKISQEKEYVEKYVGNCKKLINFGGRAYILNFNYTSITQFIGKNEQTPIEINVHGKYNDVTIFGIDQGECNVNNDEYTFSKTYRKIEENTNSFHFPQRVQPQIENQELVFYGHSLAKADYSYFQSIFDLYDIYNQTSLVFMYSIYDKNIEYEIKQEMFHRVTQLLIGYGFTMSNKDHGKNLLHKILLEGRLSVQEVKLDKINFEKKD